eukprot:1201513-Amphidinium_carterae.2
MFVFSPCRVCALESPSCLLFCNIQALAGHVVVNLVCCHGNLLEEKCGVQQTKSTLELALRDNPSNGSTLGRIHDM